MTPKEFIDKNYFSLTIDCKREINEIYQALEDYAINYTRCCEELKNDIKFERKSSARVFNNEKGIWEFI